MAPAENEGMWIARSRSRVARGANLAVACLALGTSTFASASASGGGRSTGSTAAQLSDAQAQLQSLLDDARTAGAERDRISRELSALFAGLDAARRRIESVTGGLVQAELTDRDLTASVAQAQSAVDDRAAAAYMNQFEPLDVILGSSSFSDMQSRVVYLDAVAANNQGLVTSLVQRQGALRTSRTRLDALRAGLAASISALDDHVQAVSSRLAEQQLRVSTIGADLAQARTIVAGLSDKLARERARAALAAASAGPGSPPPPKHTGDVRKLIQREFAPLGSAIVDQALCVGYHESHYDPNAVNPSSGAAGVFQFMPQIWPAMSQSAGFGGASVFDAGANVTVAAWAVARYGWSPWRADAPFCGF